MFNIFQDYIKNYDYWGFCDTDLIWGNIRQFITNEILNQYPKIGIFGHCCLIQNKPEFNKMYTTIMDGIPNYKIVFTSSLAYCFDENRCFNKFFELKQIPVYRLSMCFDVSYVYGHFYPAKSHEPQDYHNLYNAVFNWQGGQLRCVYITAKGVVCVKDILYAHFQKRAMAIDIKNTNEFSIIPNRFVDYIPSWNLILINRFAPRKLFYLPYIKRRIKYLVGKILGTNNPKFYHYNY